VRQQVLSTLPIGNRRHSRLEICATKLPQIRERINEKHHLAEPILSTDWVLAEVTDAMCRGHNRTKVVSFLRMLRRREDVVLLPGSRELFDRGLQLFGDRPDKQWSLTDCISFVVMGGRSLTEALTSDHHFEQTGFTALLKAR
jgi:uncharacterized protein